MTEERIERQVEHRMNQLDARLMVGVYDQADYDAKVLELTKWADEQYKLAGKVIQLI